MAYSSNDYSYDENPPQLTHLPLVRSIEHESTPTLPLPRWIHTTQGKTSDIASDPIDQHVTHSQF